MPKQQAKMAARRTVVGAGVSGEDFLVEVGALERIRVESVACGARHMLAATEKNNVFVWGDSIDGQVTRPPRLFHFRSELVLAWQRRQRQRRTFAKGAAISIFTE
uniref:Uncharacterized protein n=1 Tax=Palpitomonas bilix TaxID=652834 RepID=A0A7S3DIB2_9EUKA|mmetsp:Transcript_38332/g.98709  ORF Transcript_38332/g.98709 Transcript_38332/m.98709 type:complete len:105 (+) Transcript_38332:210-524(+)